MSSLLRNIYNSDLIWKLIKNSIIKELCVPCYHTVNNKSQDHIRHLYTTINEKKFEDDIDFLSKHYEFISPDELLQSLSKKELPRNKCILTFDDGYRECYDVIYPILKRRNIPAIFFIISDLVDNKNLSHFNKKSLILANLNSDSSKRIAKNILMDNHLFSGNLHMDIKKLGMKNTEIINLLGIQLNVNFENYLKELKPYLSAQQIKEMHSNGFGIGAHSNNHQKFIELDKDDQQLQIKESLDFIEKITMEPTRYFAFPYSSHGFNSDLYGEFSDVIFFDTFKGFQRSNFNIVQRFITDSFDNMNAKLVEIKLKKLSYNIRFKKLPVPSLID